MIKKLLIGALLISVGFILFDITKEKKMLECMKSADGNKSLSEMTHGWFTTEHNCPEACDKLGDTNGQEYTDLGLPSGTLWAVKNLKAKDKHLLSDFVPWGEHNQVRYPEKKDNYKFYSVSDTKDADGFNVFKEGYTKYVHQAVADEYGFDGYYDNKQTLDLEDDAVHAKMGGSWRLPTKCDFHELLDWCTCEIAYLNDHAGYKFVSRINGNWLFLPISEYWTNQVSSNGNYAWAFILSENSIPMTKGRPRYNGLQLRGVCPTKK